MTRPLPLDTGYIRNEGEPPYQARGITMGSTVSTGKQVAAFKATSGKVMYVLFEETYESNCYPRTPRWSSYMIGELPAVMRHIFRAASSCEGGMLKGAGG